MNTCPVCGGEIFGDGYSSVMHCENAPEETYEYSTPDDVPVLCDLEGELYELLHPA